MAPFAHGLTIDEHRDSESWKETLRNGAMESLLISGVVLSLLLLLPAALSAQSTGQVTGRVTNASTGEPLEGVQLFVEGTDIGSLSGADGQFRIREVPVGTQTVVADLIGFGTSRRQVDVVAGQTVQVNFRLGEEAVNLDEIVVTGTPGETQRRSLGNSLSQLNADSELERRPVQDVQELLKGESPGVTVQTGQGNIGTGGLVRMRGISSLSLDNQPVVYIDGVRVNSDPRSGPAIRGGSQASRINDINPQNIESIEIIRGPAAATLYGTEASNGVIQIITKSGASGGTQVTASVKQGANYFRNPDGRLPVNYAMEGGNLISQDLYAEEVAAGRHPFKTGHAQEYNLGIRGGSDEVRYYASGGYLNSVGMVSYNWQKKGNVRGNLEIIPTEELNVQVNLGLIESDTRFAQAASGWGVIDQFVWGNPQSRDTRLRGFLRATPEAAAEIESTSEVFRGTGSVQLRYQPETWLSARLNVGEDYTSEENQVLFPRHPEGSEYFFGSASLGDKEAERKKVTNRTVDFAVSATANVTDDLEATTSVGGQWLSEKTEILGATGRVFPAPPITTISGAAVTFSSESFVENRTLGGYVQERLGWRNRAFLTAAVRADDNSAFGENFDVVTYPKVSATYVLSEEAWWPTGTVNTFKLRGAWGKAGQQPNTFAAVRLYEPIAGPGGSSGLTPQTIGNADLKPEVGTELELGFDASLFQGRVGLDFTFYDQRRTDALIQAPTAPSTGFPGSRFVNVGEINARGIELGANATVLDLESFGWQLNGSLSTNHTEITNLGDFSSLAGGTLQLQKEGYPVSAYFMRRVVSAELDDQGNVVSAQCRASDDRDGSTVPCAEAPQVFAGVPFPTVTSNLESTFTFLDRFRLSAMAELRSGHRKITGDVSGAHHVFRNSRAINTNSSPILEAYDQLPGFSFFHSGLFDAGFLKLRNVSLNYRLPERLYGRIGLSSASLTLSGQNLAILWQEQEELFGRNIIDPENRLTTSELSGYVQTTLPHMTSLSARLNVSF